jgi:hypothetical protein
MTGISKSQVTRLCAKIDERVKAHSSECRTAPIGIHEGKPRIDRIAES